MWKKIGETLLKTGETMKIHMIEAPDPHYNRSIRSFLSHFNELWLWHLNLALHGELDELEARFYLGLVKDRIISNVSTWESGSIGLAAHLFTARNQRRKGACSAIMKAQIQDFRNRGGKTLIGGFRPSSYPIATNLGFMSIEEGSEVMHYTSDSNFEREYFQGRETSCRDTMWKDWPGVSLLFGIKDGWHLRSMKHKILGPFDYEDYFLKDMKERLKGLRVSKVLTTKEESIVGYATLAFKPQPTNGFWLLDFFIHPSTASSAGTMLQAMDFPPRKTRCYVEFSCYEKQDMLLKQGFKMKKLQKQIKHRGKKLDVVAMEF